MRRWQSPFRCESPRGPAVSVTSGTRSRPFAITSHRLVRPEDERRRPLQPRRDRRGRGTDLERDAGSGTGDPVDKGRGTPQPDRARVLPRRSRRDPSNRRRAARSARSDSRAPHRRRGRLIGVNLARVRFPPPPFVVEGTTKALQRADSAIPVAGGDKTSKLNPCTYRLELRPLVMAPDDGRRRSREPAGPRHARL